MKYVIVVLFVFSSLSQASTCTDFVDQFTAHLASNNKTELLAMMEAGRASTEHVRKESAVYNYAKEVLMLAYFNFDHVYSSQKLSENSSVCVAEIFGRAGVVPESLGHVTVKLQSPKPLVTQFQIGQAGE